MGTFVSKWRPSSPAPTCVSMKSDDSKDDIKVGDSSQQSRSLSHRCDHTPTSSLEISAEGGSNVNAQAFAHNTVHGSINNTTTINYHGTPSTLPQPAQKPDRWSPTSSKQAFKNRLSKKFQNVRVAIPKAGKPVYLEKIFTELYITEGEPDAVSTEHEIRQIEMASKKRKTKGETPIKNTDIFKPLPGQDKHIRTVMTKGVAGIGKTVSVQKFILDWAEGKANQDIDFLFPVPFREINLMKEKEYSLVDFIHHFFSETCDLIFSTDDKYNIAFIFDGLDESRQPLDFQDNECIYSVSKPASVDALLTNLINRNLLPSAQIWITSRPAAANQIPPECVDQVTEVRGFTDPQKEEYFKKNINEQEMAGKIITHLKRSRTLYIMCQIPVFCWMAATVLVSILTEGYEIPASLTQMYIHFLIMQVKYMSQKYKGICKQKTILSLGRLAFQQLEKGNLIFYEEDLEECGMDAEEASVYSGVCTQILREESGLYQKKVFCFVHLSIQEFLAALHVFLCFSNSERNMSDQQQTSQLSALFRAATLHDLHKTALDLALRSENGHLDLFLRFLLGLSLESNQNLLKDLLPQTSSQSQSSVQTVQCIKKMIRGEISYDRRINLFYCLNELNQHAVVERIYSEEGELSIKMLLPGEWRTVTFDLTMSEEQLDGFDLQKYIETPEKDQTEILSPDDAIQKLVPVVTTSTMTWLRSCKLTEKSCLHLASTLSSPSSRLTWLILNDNDLHDSGVKLLCSGLQHQHCRLETLGLASCKLTEKSCLHLVSVLSSPSSRLTCLHLDSNHLCDSGVEPLCSELQHQHQHCRLETLSLQNCKLTVKSCSLLSSALSSPSSRLKVLYLGGNDLSASDVEQLSALEKDPSCILKKLWY